MADEKKDDSAEEKAKDAAADGADPAAKPKSDVMTYVIVAVGALVVTMSVMFAMISGQQPVAVDEEGDEHAEEEVADHHEEEDPETPDIFSELDDLSFLADTQFAELHEHVEEAHGESDSHGDSHGDAKSKGKGGGHTEKSGSHAANPSNADDSLVALGWLETEKKKLDKRTKALDEKASRLAALERMVNQKLTKVDQAEAARLAGLAKLYNGMKAEQVARMMVKLDDKLIVAILPRMKSGQASKILGMLPPSRGARISKEMITLSGNHAKK